MQYPGDTADPVDVAKYFAYVAENEFGLPGILPVMASCVELPAAWTGPGDVKTVPGYLSAQDHDSLGYFQQRPSQGWGTPEQLVDADYALRAFCKAAKAVEDDSPADTPAQLGAWCQAVQRSAYPERYAERGYPMAKELLEGSSGNTEYPELVIAYDDSGWAYDPTTKAWLKSDADATLYTNADGWLWKEVEKPQPAPSGWSWPVADTEPDPNSYYYVERCPTRYSWDEGGRTDVEAWARYLIDKYPGQVWVNTYHHHPEEVWINQGVSREYDSFDVWGPGGRGDPIDYSVGQEIFSLLFNDPNAPWLEWIIWQATMYGAWNSWYGEPFGTDDFSWHYDHIHTTWRP